MRILIYGFRPYRQFRDNITEKILAGLSNRRGLRKAVFPVRFHKRQFIDAIKDYRPDVILGLGQCSRGRRLRLETAAVNRRRSDKRPQPKPIVAGGTPRLSTDLRLDLGRQGRPSTNAGDYVCNYSMYVILDFLRRRRLPVRYGFIHIPHGYDDRKAAAALCRAVRQIGNKKAKNALKGAIARRLRRRP